MTAGTTTPRAEPRAAAMSVPAFVGRARQLDLLARALARPPAVVLVEGEAGIGKSRLVQELLASPAAGNRALVGMCPPYREPSTLAPVVDALRQAHGRVADLPLSGLAGALRPLFPEWAADLPPLPPPLADAEATRYRLHRALAELIGCLEIPVLVVEDAHWADEVSLEFLLFLAGRQPTNRHPSLIVTYRPEDVPEGSLLLRLSSRLPAGVTQARVGLEPLDVIDTAQLVSSMLDGTSVSGTFASFLHERTDGVPLAVEESVRLLGDRADIVHHNGEWARSRIEALSVPPTVRDSTLERVQRQSPATRSILQAAAVVAVPTDGATLATIAGLAGTPAREGMSRAVASGLLRETGSGRLGFRHILSATAVYEAIPGPDRRRLHLRAGHALCRLDPPPTIALTRHFREASELPEWARWAESAADAAVASSDHLTAVTLLDDLVEVPALPVPVRVRLAGKLAGAALYIQAVGSDRATRIVRTLRGVLELPGLGPGERAEIRNLLGRLLNQQGEHASAFAELAAAIPHLGHMPVEAARSMISLGWPRAGRWPAATHLRWVRRAERLPTAAMSPVDRLSLVVDRAAALLQLGAEQGWTLAAELPADVATVEERLHLARGYLNIGDAATHWGRYADARRLLDTAVRLATASQFARVREIALATLTRLDWLTGAWDGLADRAGRLVEGPGTEPAAREEAGLVAGLLLAARGAHSPAEQRLRGVLDTAGQRGAVSVELTAAAALARHRLAQGRVEEAQKFTDDPIRTVTEKQIWVWAADIAPVRVEVLLRAGEPDEAHRLVTRFANGLRGRDAPAPRAALATCRALLALDGAGAPAGFSRAARAWEALPRPYDALLAHERRARCLRDIGRTDAAVAALSKAFHGLSGLGADGDAGRVAGQLRAHGVEVARPWRGGRRGHGDQLSPRELEVVRLVVTGKTNREIARVLSKAPGTVAEQLRSAMRKLGVSSRTAVAVSAIEAGVIEEQGS